MSLRRPLNAALLPLLLSACSYQDYQSDFGKGAVQDSDFLTLFTIFLVVCAIMYVLVIGFLIAGILRRGRAVEANVVETGRHHQSHPAMRTTLIGWAVLIGIGLAGLAIASFFTDRSMAKAATNQKLSIKLTANQWWWDVQYNSADPSKTMRTANELHLPVGVPVRITLASNDVIHSFWVPSLAGKQDLIPGRENDITITPKRTGIFRGQCAEFCGVQHAHMALIVDVDSYADFIKWWDHQLQPAAAPTNPAALAGYKYVTTGPCSACHNIAGTPASGTVAPDLTHLASRRSIAAGALPMGEGGLYGWVEDPQSVKPGNHMPTIGLEPDQLHSVVAYLETLK
ncbi:MAG TPA: cytochrome c oxidase subunit II [Sphingomicrobium sp.]|nr:cytochrome c oxidase subunit II [Sphingomicrobium sp.]